MAAVVERDDNEATASKKRPAPDAAPDERSHRARTAATRANILVTGTPGTGKSATAAAIAQRLGMEVIAVSALAQEVGAVSEWDEARHCHVLDEDAVLDAMEPKLARGGCVVEYHSCELFPERWFDLVLVLRASTEVLYDRLRDRAYAPEKLAENMQCEIMQVVLEEAREAYATEIVVELRNDTRAELDANLDRVAAWHERWLRERSELRDLDDSS